MISIIIPVFNRGDLLVQTLQSILDSGSCHKEIIIVDDGSSEDIEKLIKEQFFDFNIKYHFQNNLGASAARNFGLKLASFDYVLFFDSDDLIEKNFIEERIKILNANKDLTAVYGPWEHFQKTGDQMEIIPRYSPYPMYQTSEGLNILENLLGGWYLTHCTIIWRKNLILSIQGYNEDLKVNQDVDMLFRAIVFGIKIKGVADLPKLLIREHTDIRVGKVNSSTEKLQQVLDLRKYFHKELQASKLYSSKLNNALSNFLFEMWIENRKFYPKLSEEFLKFSFKLNSKIEVKGGKILRMISKIIGSKNAIILKQQFKS